jgi:DNA-binding response OmpR family regulator
MTGGRVLVLDHDDVSLDATRTALEAEGFVVPVLRTPFLLFEALHEERPDVLLMEVETPQLRADKTLEILRGFGALEGVLVLLYSSLPEVEGRAVADRVEAIGYVPKTAGVPALVARVKEAVERSHADRVRVPLV